MRIITPEHASRHVLTAFFILAACLGTLLHASGEDPSRLTLDRIFTDKEFTARSFGPVVWLTGGSDYTVLEPSESVSGARDIVRYHCESGRREIAVPARRLIPSGERTPLKIETYVWSPDQMKLLLTVPAARAGRTASSSAEARRGAEKDYWILDLTFWNLRRLGDAVPAGILQAAVFSPDSRKVGFVGGNDLYVEDLYTAETLRITGDGSGSLINGASNRLYSGLNATGLRWSPDGRKIAFLQFDTTGVKDFHLINNTDSLYPQIISFQHVKPGERLPACRAGVVSASGGEVTWLQIPGEARDHYISQLDWSSNARDLVVQQLNRSQNRLLIMMADGETGKVRSILTEEDETWIEARPLSWINAGNDVIWVSEKGGWRDLYKVSINGKSIVRLTPGRFDVMDIRCIDEKDGWLYYSASPEDPTRRYLYRVRLDGSERIERITPEGEKGTHDYQISPSSRWAVHTFSTIDTPPVIRLIRLPNHEPVRVLEDNAVLREKMGDIDRRPTEFFRVDIGMGAELDGWCIRPVDFDPGKRYPALFYVYSMPAGQTVLDQWEGDRHLWHLMMAQHGYLVMSVDSRGTPAPRGRAWRKIIYKKHGLLPSDDQAAAVRAITARWSWVDGQRIGVYGWSGGGLMSLLCLFRYPDIYQTAMAGAYLSNHRLYHAAFTERFLGLPQDNPEVYRETAALTYVDNLKGNLLLIHGTGDDNVHYQSTEVLINELVEAKKRFSLMAYPNRSHGLSEGQHTQYHRFDLYMWYLSQNMPGGPR